MTTVDITRRDYEGKWGLPIDQSHLFKLKRFFVHVLEAHDVHFSFDSAVLLPDRATDEGGATSAARITGLAVLRAAYKHAKDNPSHKLLIPGHTDTSGPEDYNLKLSQQRADNVLAALTGDKNTWVDLCMKKHKVEDVQLILKWVNVVEGYGCDPGPITNIDNPQTKAATKEFQKKYNEDFGQSISEDGIVGKQTWAAFFDVYMDILKELLETDDAGLQQAQQSLKFVDGGKKAVGCGEFFPVDQPRKENYKSVTNRRVELLFFEPGNEPKLECHPGHGQCNPKKCELYNNVIFIFKRIDPEPVQAPLLRMKLEMGDIDKLFPPIATKAASDAGVRARLQAVGFLYQPVQSSASTLNPAATEAFKHFKTVINKAADAAAVDELQKMVKELILDTGKVPPVGEFGIVRYPGTYCVRTAKPPFADESRVWDDNESLGLIPILAKVEVHARRKWKPAGNGLKVHFQLIEPDKIDGAPFKPPAFRSTTITSVMNNSSPPPAQFTFNMTGSPQKYITDEKARNPAVAGDPQVDNAHSSVGGKRNNATAGSNRLANVLETTTERAGFHDTLNLKAAATSRHNHAVEIETNNNGEACLIFMPSRTSGDRYKLRAFLDPVRGQPSNGTEDFAVKQDTGTFVVMRIMRISKYLRWDYPAGSTAAQKTTCGGDLGNFDISGKIVDEFKKSFLDAIVEPGADSPRAITQAEWQQAINFAKAAVGPVVTVSQPYNINVLIASSDPAGGGLNNPSPGIINFLTAAQYNAAAKGPPPAPFPAWPAATATGPSAATYWADMASIRFQIQRELMKFFTKNAISGMTVIQSPAMSNFESDNIVPGSTPLFYNSGWGGDVTRGCYVVFGEDVYTNPSFPYSSTHNTLHELGHVLYQPHQYTTAAQVNVNTGGDFDDHDYHDLCIMGYMKSSTDFCGRCALEFSGYDVSSMPANNPGP